MNIQQLQANQPASWWRPRDAQIETQPPQQPVSNAYRYTYVVLCAMLPEQFWEEYILCDGDDMAKADVMWLGTITVGRWTIVVMMSTLSCQPQYRTQPDGAMLLATYFPRDNRTINQPGLKPRSLWHLRLSNSILIISRWWHFADIRNLSLSQ